MNMGRAYLDFSERRPRAVRDAVLHPPHRDRRGPETSTATSALDGLVALLRDHNPAVDSDDACELAILIWSSLHGYAMLRAVRPHLDWPEPEVYLRRLLSAYAPTSAERAALLLAPALEPAAWPCARMLRLGFCWLLL